jgi:membrane protein
MIRKLFAEFADFIRAVYNGIIHNDLVDMANALSFKLILSIFPFIIFLMSLIAFLEVDVSGYLVAFTNNVPGEVGDIINTFIDEVVNTKRVTLLSSSLLVAMVSASSGFFTLMKGLNRAYDVTIKRNYLFRRFISLLLVIIFTALIITSLYICMFSDILNDKLFANHPELSEVMLSVRSYAVAALLMFFMIILIYLLAVEKKIGIRRLIPGALFTMGLWLVVSKCFNIYVNNFSRYSAVYGSIGAIFVFALWINFLSYALLIGGQINAVIYDKMEVKHREGR